MPFETAPFESLTASELDAFKQKDGKLHLFSNIGCPYGHRALWTAVEVNAPFHVVEVSLTDPPAAYSEKFNRYGTVPYLLSNGSPVYESAIIAQYLDTKHGGGELFRRSNPEEAALTQLAAAKFEAGPLYQLLRKFSDENVAELKESLAEVEAVYRVNGADYRAKGPYLLGKTLSNAEILTSTVLFRFEIVLKHYHNFDLLSDFPLVAAALAAVKTRPAFQQTIREPQLYIDMYAKFVAK
ncbi:hypothetical protein DYB25_001350 [Aphanomyces astaci]|uniref:GST N-terminal domain-containing protein n=1 Tax=Aphanomyces astaci TaxID=112090 RepID=A0A397BYG9_APHAT|nr:hypothetical protein DYB25_001350 [Aphanomyces astaci]RHY72035.1 hypothetical protein DYB30_007659 [Aphanomyces astaci]RHY72270.1 hypothetical protein DYB38_001146 [Aphanomyces astaci]RHZ10745.1 hypothetical protein DYB26_008557 [Aphanomyces astaci]